MLAVMLVAAACTSANDEPTAAPISRPASTTTAPTPASAVSTTTSIVETATPSDQSTSTVSSPYSACAEYRDRLEGVEYVVEGDREAGRIREVQNEKWLTYPSPNEEGVRLTLDEALEIGKFLHASATAQVIREVMEEIAQEPPPQPVRAEHAELVEALYQYAEATLDYAVAIYPTKAYGDQLGSPPSPDELADFRHQIDAAYLRVEDAWKLAALLCPDP